MNVTQCDVCGNIVINEQIMALNVYRVRRNSMNSMIGGRVMYKELCPACFEKLSKLFTPKEDNNVEQKHTEKITDEIE